MVKIPWACVPARKGACQQFLNRGYRVLCASVAEKHSHLLAELPFDFKDVRKLVGHCKGAHPMSCAMSFRKSLVRGAKYEMIKDRSITERV